MSGYRGFPSKQAYEDYYSDPKNYAAEIQNMEDYVNECEVERQELEEPMNKVASIKMQDIAAEQGVQIQIHQNGLVVWINVDGICVARIIANGLTVPIEIEDMRK